MMNIFVINGLTGAGKDTFIDFCSKRVNCVNVHSSTPAKEALTLLGWDGERDPVSRNLLAYLMDWSRKYYDGATKYMLNEIKHAEARGVKALFLHVREPEQIHRLQVALVDFKTVFIDRDIKLPKGVTNASDVNVKEWKNYDVVISNNGSLADLNREAEEFVERWCK